MMQSPLVELRSAARRLVRAPGFTLSAIACLAFGLGVTTAVFSAIDRALLQPLPFHDPGSLVTVFRAVPQGNTWPFSAPNYEDLARASRTLDGLAATTPTTNLLALADGGLQVAGYRVTGNLFGMLGVQAVRGRLLIPSDDAPGAQPVVVLGEVLWRTRFGADPGLVGRTINLDGHPTWVVGIAPADFRLPHGSQVLHAQLWLPMRFTAQEKASRGNNFLMTMGRLKRGVPVAACEAELRGLYAQLAESFPSVRGESVRVVSLQEEGARSVRTPLLLLFGAAAFVLLIAATNVAGLLVARGVQRRREMAVRVALGGGQWAVLRPVLAETLLLAAAAVAVGLFLSWVGVRTIGALAAERVPQLAGLTIDARVLAFALAVTGLVALLCAVIPTLRHAGLDPQEALRGGARGGDGRAQRLGLQALVVAEVALTLVLLLGAGLVLKGFARLLGRDPGFDPRPLLLLEATVSPERYPGTTGVQRFLEPALEAIRRVPGVEGAASISLVPYLNWGWNFNIRYEGRPVVDNTHLPLVETRVVTPGLFGVTGQRLVSGRLLTDADDDRPESPAVVVVNQALVRRDFPGESPIGKRFYTGDTTFATIVGVVSDIRNSGPYRDPAPEIYATYRQGGWDRTSYPVMVRVRGSDPTVAVRPILAAIHAVDRGAAVSGVQPMRDAIGKSVAQPRFYLTLLGVFAAVALALAMAGLYGVIGFTVAQRQRELGIRIALGSSGARTLRLVAREGMVLVAAGAAMGLAGGAWATALLRSLLYGVSPLDPLTWVLATAALACAGLLATLVPAARATRVDPMVALRAE